MVNQSEITSDNNGTETTLLARRPVACLFLLLLHYSSWETFGFRIVRMSTKTERLRHDKPREKLIPALLLGECLPRVRSGATVALSQLRSIETLFL